MTTELWFRDPLDYIRQCASLLVPNIIWEGRILDQKNHDAQAHLEMHYPTSFDYRILVVRTEGTVELRRGYSPDMPYAVYQTWAYEEDSLDDLEDMLGNPPGEDMALCTDANTPTNRRPVFGQEHRVVITRWPDPKMTLGRAFLRALSRYQLDYPEVIIHLWGTQSYRAIFGMKIRAGDFDAAQEAKFKTVTLPNGRRVLWEQAAQFPQWVHLLGFAQAELSKAPKRIEFNIKSAQWAADYFETELKFKSQGHDPVDPNTHHHLPATSVNIMSSAIQAQDGDKVTCDACSLFKTCKYYREGAVCSLPDNDYAKLAGYFGTRSADVVIDGLGQVMMTQASRFQRGTEDEEFQQELDPNVTKLGHVIMQDGEKLAKLLDPRLAAAGAARVTAFMGGNHIHTNVTATSLVSEIVQELEQAGIDRANITEDMVMEHITKQHAKAIEAQARE